MQRDVMALARERFDARDYLGTIFVLRSAEDEGELWADALNLLGLALAMVDRREEALDAFARALSRNPRYVEALVNRGIVLSDVGRADEARADFAKAAELGRPDATGFPAVVANRLANRHATLGDEYRAAGALEEAVAQYRQALALRPAFADIRLALGRALVEHGEHAAAARELDEALRLRPEWLDAMLLRGLAAYLSGELEAAGEIWDRASRHHPDKPRLALYRATLARRPAASDSQESADRPATGGPEQS